MQQTSRADPFRVALATAVPLGLLALAYAAWAFTDWIGVIGPFDKAKLGWLIVMPLVGSVPVGAAIAWRRLPSREIPLAGIGLAVVLGIATAFVFWLNIAFPDCQYGSRTTEVGALWIAAVVGLLAGGGYALCSLLAASLWRAGRPWWASLIGAGAGVGMLWLVAIVAALLGLAYAGCNRLP